MVVSPSPERQPVHDVEGFFTLFKRKAYKMTSLYHVRRFHFLIKKRFRSDLGNDESTEVKLCTSGPLTGKSNNLCSCLVSESVLEYSYITEMLLNYKQTTGIKNDIKVKVQSTKRHLTKRGFCFL